MGFNKLISMKKSRKAPQEGDIFCLQPQENIFYFGKVIKANLTNKTAFIHGNTLIYIYDACTCSKEDIPNLNGKDLLIPPIIINRQLWLKGYFETISNVEVTEVEENLDYGFLVPGKKEKEFLDIYGNVLEKNPKYYSIYGLGSYGIIGKEVEKAITLKMQKEKL